MLEYCAAFHHRGTTSGTPDCIDTLLLMTLCLTTDQPWTLDTINQRQQYADITESVLHATVSAVTHTNHKPSHCDMTHAAVRCHETLKLGFTDKHIVFQI